jgi:hypothetical protein
LWQVQDPEAPWYVDGAVKEQERCARLGCNGLIIWQVACS